MGVLKSLQMDCCKVVESYALKTMCKIGLSVKCSSQILGLGS